MSEDSDDGEIAFSKETLEALAEFYDSQQIPQNELESGFEENWQLSQFWYSDDTAKFLAEEIIRQLNSTSKRLALISCPTLFVKLKEILTETFDDYDVILFEYDSRFSCFGAKYIHYDYNEPQSVSEEFAEKSFDMVVADPPFLSTECLDKVAESIKYLAKDKVIICTGSVMTEHVSKTLGLEPSQQFIPQHKRKLGNEFRCFSNFEIKCNNF